jgi:hypothetical protein
MNKNDFDKELNKYIVQLKELEPKARQQGDSCMQYSTDKLKKLTETGQMPKELGAWYLEWIKDQNLLFGQWTNFIKNNPEIPEKDRITQFYGLPKTLSHEETLKIYESALKHLQIHTHQNKVS